MILNLNEVKKITAGAHLVEQTEAGFVFHKCTAAQEAAWYTHSETLGTRARTTTGIRLDFYTNSRSFGIRIVGGGKFELHINGILREQVTEKGTYSWSVCDVRGNACDNARVTLIFPSHSIGIISDVELDDGASITPVSYKKKLLFIGDSITQGHATVYDSFSFAWRVTDYFDAASVINGIGGAFYSTRTFDVPDFDPDAVIIAYGTNDFGRGGVSLEEKHAEIDGYLDLVKANYGGKRVIVLSPIWRCTAEGENMREEFHAFRLYIENSAHERGFVAIDGLSLVPPMRSLYADGHLHPNDLGFAIYAENLIKQIKDLI